MEPKLNEFISFLKSKGANECFHKTSTFLHHLLGVHHILQAWKAPIEVCRLGLFHSIYGTSWVSLKICSDRKELQDLIGKEAEELVFDFCNLNRMKFTFEFVLGQLYHQSCNKSMIDEYTEFEGKKMSKRRIAIFILLTLSDWLDQWVAWQDDLFQTEKRKDLAEFFIDCLEDKKGTENANAIWPGNHKPGLYLHVLSRLNQVLQKCNQSDLTCPILLSPISL